MLVNHTTLGWIEVSRIRSVTAESARRHNSDEGVVASFQRGNKLAGSCRLTIRNVSLVDGFSTADLRQLAELNDQTAEILKSLDN